MQIATISAKGRPAMTKVFSNLGVISALALGVVAGGISTGCGSSKSGGPSGTGGTAGQDAGSQESGGTPGAGGTFTSGGATGTSSGGMTSGGAGGLGLGGMSFDGAGGKATAHVRRTRALSMRVRATFPSRLALSWRRRRPVMCAAIATRSSSTKATASVPPWVAAHASIVAPTVAKPTAWVRHYANR